MLPAKAQPSKMMTAPQAALKFQPLYSTVLYRTALYCTVRQQLSRCSPHHTELQSGKFAVPPFVASSQITKSLTKKVLPLATPPKPPRRNPIPAYPTPHRRHGTSMGTQSGKRDAVLVSAARTPIGSFGGSLAGVPATELGAIAIKGALERGKVRAEIVEACYMGNVYSAGLGQAPARQAALKAGLPESCVCTTVNKVCSSGLKSITLAAQDIALGVADVVVAGGMESMSNVPYYLTSARFGYRMGDGVAVDGLLHDGLRDAGVQEHMGMFAERCAKRYGITRGDQDDCAVESYERSLRAWRQGKFRAEVVGVRTKVRRKEVELTEDEEPGRTEVGRIGGMKGAFVKDGSGTVTSGNASGLNDGAAAVVLMSREKAEEVGVRIVGRVLGYADAELAAEEFTTAPAVAIPKAMRRAGVGMGDVDVFEVNEAFAVVSLVNRELLGLDKERTNVFGGAVSLGHPLGCSGARIVVTMMSVLEDRKGRIGVAGICNGGGGSTAIVVERVNDEGQQNGTQAKI